MAVLTHQAEQALQAVARREYMHGWRYGLVCGLLTGASTTALAAWLLVVAILSVG